MEEKTLKALCEPNRYKLLALIQQRSYCVAALALESGLSESSVSQHLKILREADLVQGVKKGFYTHYILNREALQKVIDELNLLTQATPKKCGGKPFYGCPQAEIIKCKAYIPPEDRHEEKKD